jgi:hypothetical protein
MPSIDPYAISRMIWISTAGATAAAIIGTAIVYVLRDRIIDRVVWKGVGWLATIFTLVGVYVMSAIVSISLLHLQVLRIEGPLYVATIYVYPAFEQRLIPLLAILITWICRTLARRRRVIP